MRDFLHEAFRGEQFGIAFFSAFAEQAKNEEELEKWLVLIELERHTAQLLKTWLDENGQVCDEYDAEMQVRGRDKASSWLDLEWHTLMDNMAPWIEDYAISYRERATSALPEMFQICDMLAAHEEAIFSFVQAEKLGEDDSLKAVRVFMKEYPIT